MMSSNIIITHKHLSPEEENQGIRTLPIIVVSSHKRSSGTILSVLFSISRAYVLWRVSVPFLLVVVIVVVVVQMVGVD